MHMSTLMFSGLLQTFMASASPLFARADIPSIAPNRPIAPYHPGGAWPASTPRNRTCVVPNALGGGKDDAANILATIKSCNSGGHVVFGKTQSYTIGTALDLTFLNSIDLDIQGTIKFTNDTTYWQASSFKHVYQNSSSFFQLGGKDVNVYGAGTLDGNGQVWYDAYAKSDKTLRPILFAVIGLQGGRIEDLKWQYSPQWYSFVANSSHVVFSDITISGKSSSSNEAKNTDGWDTYRSDNIVIQNSNINNGDDCVSFKPNSTNVVVQNLICNGSHGISVGSLGQYPTEVDIVQNVTVYNISMSNAQNGARIKVWPGSAAALSGDLQGGGGSGMVKNITYDTFVNSKVDIPIDITQCYGQSDLTKCNADQYPSKLTISDVTLRNISGNSTKDTAGYLVCSSTTACSNINLENITVKGKKGTSVFTCANIAGIDKEITCQAP